MPTGGKTTLTQFLIEERRRAPEATGDLNALITDVSLACKAISRKVAYGALGGMLGSAGASNVQGEEQKALDVISNSIFLRANEWGGHVAAMVSEELEQVYTLPSQYPRGKYLLMFDPLDGSSNIDVNVAVGSIFSITRALSPGSDAQAADFLLTEENIHTAIVFGVIVSPDQEETIVGSMRTSRITIDPDEFLKEVFGKGPGGRYFGGGKKTAGGFEIPVGFLSGGSDKEFRDMKWKLYKAQITQKILNKIGAVDDDEKEDE